jgi:hypothetical protein
MLNRPQQKLIGSGAVPGASADIDFICIGAQKAGTTYVRSVFRKHPEIQLPKFKELYFFSGKGEYKSSANFAVSNADKDLSWYGSQFVNDSRKKGEISTHYITDASSAAKIKRAFSEVKLFAILRDPTDRAFSQYNMERYRTGKERRSLLQIIREEPDNEIITRGFYYKQLVPFFDSFQADQIKIFLFDDLTEEPTVFLKDLFEFIGVDSTFTPPRLEKKVNKGKRIRIQSIRQLEVSTLMHY